MFENIAGLPLQQLAAFGLVIGTTAAIGVRTGHYAMDLAKAGLAYTGIKAMGAGQIGIMNYHAWKAERKRIAQERADARKAELAKQDEERVAREKAEAVEKAKKVLADAEAAKVVIATAEATKVDAAAIPADDRDTRPAAVN